MSKSVGTLEHFTAGRWCTSGKNGDGASQPGPGTRVGCYGCFLPDLTGFTTYRHRGGRPPPP